jgi:hypothetical protein
MKTKIKTQWMTALLATGLLAAWSGLAVPIDDTTDSGDGKCKKCSLKETDSCQLAVNSEEDGKKVTYYLANNAVSKDFQSQHMICKKPAKVKATGSVKESGGKMELTATKIELAKD